MKLSVGEKIVDHVVLIVFGVFAIMPLIGVLLSAVTPSKENSGRFALPSRIDLGNFGQAWTDGHFSTYMWSSLVVTVAVVLLTTVLAILAAFAFARLTFRGSTVIFFVLLAGLMLPAEAFVIPLYFNLRSVKPDRHVRQPDPAADRPVTGLRHLLAAEPVPQLPDRDHRRRPGRRGARPAGAVAGDRAALDRTDHDDVRADHDVDVERVPDPAGADRQRGPADRARSAWPSSRAST